MRILVSRDEKTCVTAVLVHGVSKSVQTFLENAMRRRDFWYLTIHPIFMFGLIAEVLRKPIIMQSIYNSEKAIKPVFELLNHKNSNTTKMEVKNANIEDEAAQALLRQHIIEQVVENIQWLLRVVQKWKSWCKNIHDTGNNQVESEALRTAGQIILKRLEDIEVGLEGDRIPVQTAQALTQAHRQSVRDTIISPSFPY